MKRYLVLLLVLFSYFPAVAHAAGIGNSIRPVGKHKFSFSMEDNLIFNKPIRAKSGIANFDLDTVNQAYAKVTFGATDNINIYGKLGASDSGTLKMRFDDHSTTDVRTHYGLLWGIGAGGLICEIYNKAMLGTDIQYSGWQATVDNITESGQDATKESGRIGNKEFQAALFVTRKFPLSKELEFSPYAGGRFSYFNTRTMKTLNYQTPGTAYQLSWDQANKRHFGAIVGADIFLPNYYFQLSVEGRFFDETGLTTGLSYRY